MNTDSPCQSTSLPFQLPYCLLASMHLDRNRTKKLPFRRATPLGTGSHELLHSIIELDLRLPNSCSTYFATSFNVQYSPQPCGIWYRSSHRRNMLLCLVFPRFSTCDSSPNITILTHSLLASPYSILSSWFSWNTSVLIKQQLFVVLCLHESRNLSRHSGLFAKPSHTCPSRYCSKRPCGANPPAQPLIARCWHSVAFWSRGSCSHLSVKPTS
jgi:hypothetical protein